jgi:hypothetical protein
MIDPINFNSLNQESRIDSTSQQLRTTNAPVQRDAHSVGSMDSNRVKYDFYTPLSWKQRIINAFKSINLIKIIGGAINARTIIIGASIDWDPIRLVKGKHATLHLVGAEHIQMKSKTGETVDGHFLEANEFISNLEKMDGRRKIFQLAISENSHHNTKNLEPLSENLTAPFPGFQFSKDAEGWKKAKEMLEKLNISESNWRICESDTAMYLVRAEDRSKLDLAFSGKEDLELKTKDPEPQAHLSERGTVLLSTNQLTVYEQTLPEILTFALEGMNVMVYNNPSKGLSSGPPDRENINASIEAAYQFITQVKKVPDEKILAKGQCFGAAPTAWLGKKHPDINLMLDQNPANFQDVGLQKIERWAESIFPANKQPTGIKESLKAWFANFIRNNVIINAVVVAILKGYDVPGDLSMNKGHKLLNIDIPDRAGKGGDDLVPKYHLMLMLDAISDTEGKEVRLSMNPGAIHVSYWWTGKESADAVLNFLDKTHLRKSLF